MRESIWDEGRERRGASKVSTVINIRSARSVESDHVRIRVSINRREQRIIHDRGDAVSGASGWKHVTSEPCHGIEDVVFEGEKKIHFQRFPLSLGCGNATQCLGQRWIEGSSEAGEAIPSFDRGKNSLRLRDFLKLIKKFFAIPPKFNRYNYLSFV